MNVSSKIGYYPIQKTDYNKSYTNSILLLSNAMKKYFSKKDFLEDGEVLVAKNDLKNCMNQDRQINSIEDSQSLFKDINRLGLFPNNDDELYELGKYARYIKYEDETYIGNSIITDVSLNLMCEFKNDSPKAICALFTDEEYSLKLIKMKTDTLLKRFDRIKEITTLSFPTSFIYLIKNIKQDLEDGRVGIIAYQPLRDEKYSYLPSQLRKEYNKNNIQEEKKESEIDNVLNKLNKVLKNKR